MANEFDHDASRLYIVPDTSLTLPEARVAAKSIEYDDFLEGLRLTHSYVEGRMEVIPYLKSLSAFRGSNTLEDIDMMGNFYDHAYKEMFDEIDYLSENHNALNKN